MQTVITTWGSPIRAQTEEEVKLVAEKQSLLKEMLQGMGMREVKELQARPDLEEVLQFEVEEMNRVVKEVLEKKVETDSSEETLEDTTYAEPKSFAEKIEGLSFNELKKLSLRV